MLTKPLLSSLRVAVIHDWLNGMRGGERVLEAMLELFPAADLFTLFYTPGVLSPIIENRKIQASVLNSTSFIRRRYRYLLPLFPFLIERFSLENYDLILSSSHCVAKGVKPPQGTLHVCYCHTPMRYVWDKYPDYFHGFTEPFISPIAKWLRHWDVKSSSRVNHFIANSEFVRHRIRSYYKRESTVIHPFVDLERFRPQSLGGGDYYLIVSAFAPYKRIDLAIEACRRLDRKLVVVGSGQMERRLRSQYGGKVEFIGNVPHSELPQLYSGARALLFPGEEDFGITPLESMACGTPVIAYGSGGILDSVIPGKTGITFPEQTADSVVEAIKTFESGSHSITPLTARKQAEQFSREKFQKKFLSTIKEWMPPIYN